MKIKIKIKTCTTNSKSNCIDKLACYSWCVGKNVKPQKRK